MRMILRRVMVIPIVVAAFVLAGCGAASSTAGSHDPDDRPSTIVATTSIWADIASTALCDRPVSVLIPPGADPHSFEPSLRDRELLEDARLIISNGSGLEGVAGDLIEAASTDDAANIVEMVSLVDTLDGDPHIWQDPIRVSVTLAAIAGAAAERNSAPSDAAVCVDRYRAELVALDIEIAALIATVPAALRVMVTSHDSLGYFADRYGIEIVGTVIPSTNTLAEANAADLAILAKTIESLGVPAVFTDRLESSSDANRLAERLGVAIVPLLTDALTDDPEFDTYIEMMRSNATAIAQALTP